MDRRTVEKRLSGSRTEGHYVVPGPRGNGAAVRRVKALTSCDPENLCSDCRWPEVCAADAVCWHDEGKVAPEVERYRRRERRGQLHGNVGDVAPATVARGVARDVGSGENAHPWIEAIAQLVDDADRPLEIRVPVPLPDANVRLMHTLGVTVVVDPDAPSIEEQRRAHGTKTASVVLEAASDSGSSDEVEEPEPVESPTVRRLRKAEERRQAAPGPPKRRGPAPKWTRETAIESVQQWARAHDGQPPRTADTKGCGGVLPQSVTLVKLGLSWADLIEQAGFPRPTSGRRRTKDSSGLAARPLTGGDPESPDEQEPTPVATGPAPPAQVAQLERAPASPAGDLGSNPGLRFALLGVLDSLRVLVDVVFPEEPTA